MTAMSDILQPSMIERNNLDMDDVELDLELSSDQEAQGANGSALATSKLSSKKKEALSQVPCKFFRSNGCSAGNSCPFAHISPGEGQGKAVCQWFLKGSCRFGHKCALAHILPGQPMSMDRKNKRAAQHQQQNQTLPSGMNGQGATQLQQQQQHNPQRPQPDQRQHSNRSSFIKTSSGRALDLSSNIMSGYDEAGSPSSRPAVTSHHREGDLLFGVPDDLQTVNPSPHGLPSQPIIGSYRQSEWKTRLSLHGEEADPSLRRSNDNGYEMLGRSGAVGSPMSTHAFGTSPFSHPGSQSVFFSHDTASNRVEDDPIRSWNRVEESSGIRAATAASPWSRGDQSVDINEEDFLPSSLSDLLTPAELLRRSRSGLSLPKSLANNADVTPQSMPAASKLWDNSGALKQRWLDHPNSWLKEEEEGESLGSVRERLARDRSAMMSAAAAAAATASSSTSSPSNTFLQPSAPNMSVSNVSAGFLGSRLRRGLSSAQGEGGLGSNNDFVNARPTESYSPGAHAALSHAPGQSLPQGLAAGLSRLHLRADNNISHDNGSPGTLHSDSRSSIWGHHGNGGVIGYHSKSGGDELGPTAPSSIFAAKTPINLAMNRSQGGSVSTSYEAVNHPSMAYSSNGRAATAAAPIIASSSTSVSGTPYARSPAHRMEGGIAIPSIGGMTMGAKEGTGAANSLGSSSSNNNNNSNSINNITSNNNSNNSINNYINSTNNNNNKISLPNHPGLHRVRTAGMTGSGSPLALPTTGEEVEEPIFELE